MKKYELKTTLFHRCRTEYDLYEIMQKCRREGLKIQHERFRAVHAVISLAGLEEEYEEWRRNNG